MYMYFYICVCIKYNLIKKKEHNLKRGDRILFEIWILSYEYIFYYFCFYLYVFHYCLPYNIIIFI